MRPERLAWALFGVCVATSAAGLVLLAQVPSAALEVRGGSLLLSATFAVVLLVFGLVGAIVASRLPGNPIGWLFLGLDLIEGAFELAYGYAHYALEVSPLPAVDYAAWLASWLSPVSPALLGLAFLLFPDGQLLSRRWKAVAWLCVLAIVPVVAHHALAAGPLADFPSVRNPVGVQSALISNLSPDLFILPILCSAVLGVIVRFRRSHGVERQQLKMFAWSAGLVAAFVPVAGLVSALTDSDSTGAESAAGFVFAILFAGLPVAAGVAILRHGLYEIDLVINRTLVYAVLTATLVATYLASVLTIRLLVSPVTGDSNLAVAGSTLAVAGLFRPARGRIQHAVDRRFYRARYDAARTLEGFAARLRNELDVDAVGADLRRVVFETVQPAHLTLWLRSAR